MTTSNSSSILDSSEDSLINIKLKEDKIFRSLFENQRKFLTPQRQIDGILKILDESMTNLTRRCNNIKVELNGMNQDVTSDIELTKEYLLLTKKEIDLKINGENSGSQHLPHIDLSKYVNKRIKDPLYRSLKDKLSQALFNICTSPTIPVQDKIKLIFSRKCLYKIRKKLLKKYILPQLKKEIDKLKYFAYKGLSDDEIETLNEMINYPDIEGIQGLEFLNKEREESLMITNQINFNLLKMVCGCLGYFFNYSEVKPAYELIFKKYNVKSIKDLFLNVIYKRVFKNMIDEEMDVIAPIIKSITPFRDLISENLIKNQRNPFGFVAESLDEIDSFLSNLILFDDNMKKGYKILLRAKELKNYYNKLEMKVK